MTNYAKADQFSHPNAIVFQHLEVTETDSATHDIPRVFGGASIWIMKSDGSDLRLLRHPGLGANARHLDHSSVSGEVIQLTNEPAYVSSRPCW